MNATVKLLAVAATLAGSLALSGGGRGDTASATNAGTAEHRPISTRATRPAGRPSAGVPGVRLCPGAQTCDGTNER